MPLIREDGERFARLIAATADAKRLDPSLVEKAYWAVEALRAVHAGFDVDIANQTVRIQPIFKGGTSLSKAFGLIERFSEDVDLLVPVPWDSPDGYSQSQRSDVMRAATEAVSSALSIPGERKGGRKGVDRHWRYPYDPRTGSPETLLVEPSIRVEVTVMGGGSPRSPRLITSVADLAAALDGFPTYSDLDPVTIETLAPERTLVEKLAMLHDAAHQAVHGQPGRLRSAGRHFYDIAMLLRSDSVRTMLSAEWVATIAADADRWSERGRFPFTARPDTGFADSPAFIDESLMPVVADSYRFAMAWVWGEHPRLEDCIAAVRDSAALL